MNQKNNGGPAFPEQIAVTPTGDTYSGETGMTLRDYFAAKAMSTLILAGVSSDYISAEAYKIADAMLAERAK